MVAFVATLGELFRMKRNQQHTDDFNAEKRKMRIPLYQREYTWPEERISALILDIISRDKFLGNIILDELDDHYEIADGQQRITTCLLILAELFNRYSGSPYEQASIRAYLTAQNGEIVLKNDSIGEYLIENAGRYDLTIDDANDVFSQKKTFEAAKEIISSTLSEHLSSDEDIRQFKSKLLDCNFLVLINNRQENRTPIEQVFLDINEKAQLLAPEDIFKGHCFERYTDDYYDELRNTWIELKKQAGSFIRFGIKNLSEYLYLYILEATDADINNSIAVGGKHYLDSKNMDEIKEGLNPARIEAIKEYVENNFVTDDARILEKNRKDLVRGCEKYQQHGIESKAAYFSFCESVFHIMGEINEKKIELTRLKRDIGSFREEAGEKIIADIARLEQKKEESADRRTRKQVLLEQAEARLADLESQLAKLSQTDSEGKLCQRKLETTGQLEKVFSAYKSQLLEEKRRTVEQYATEVFREITNAPQKYKGIKIDKDYSLLLELTNGETYQIEPGRTLNPSTGQSKVISLSYIAGLNRSSNYAAPVIIDNPLGLFSDEHRTAITKYLPHFSKQVIFMVSTGDLTEKYRDILAPYIKSEYWLTNESDGTWSKTTIASKEVH